MPWIKVDDHFDEHPKLSRVGPLGVVLWVTGLAYCNRNLTDGFIPWSVARSLVTWEFLRPHPDDPDRELVHSVDIGCGTRGWSVTADYVIDMLVEAGLWETAAGGYLVHDYGDYQPTKEQVVAERRRWAAKKAKGRMSRGESPGESPGESGRPVPVPVPNEV